MKHLLKPLMVLALSGALAACTGGARQDTLATALTNLGSDALKDGFGRRKEDPLPVLTRELLDGVQGSVLEITVEETDTRAYMFTAIERRDQGPGQVHVWISDDRVSMSMRNGVLIAMRGLGNDLLSSSSADQLSGDRPGPVRGGERVYRVLARDNKSVPYAMACALEDQGPETIEIVELRFATRHLRETCEGAGGRIVNDYWADDSTGIVWKSRQWAGPGIGYLRTRRLNK